MISVRISAALAHATGQGLGIGVLEAGEAELLEILARLLLGLLLVDAASLQPEQHIAHHRAPRKQQVFLHHVTDAAAQAFDFLAAIGDSAAIGLQQACDDVEDGRLAAAAGANDADEIAVVDGEGEVVEHIDVTALAGKRLADVLDSELNLFRRHVAVSWIPHIRKLRAIFGAKKPQAIAQVFC
jgi:hypothetical protein